MVAKSKSQRAKAKADAKPKKVNRGPNPGMQDQAVQDQVM